VLIALGIFCKPFTDKLCAKIPGFTPKSKLRHLLCIFKTLFVVLIGRYIVASDSFRHGCSLLKKTAVGIFLPSSWSLFWDNMKSYGFDFKQIKLLAVPLLTLLAVSLLQENGIRIRQTFAKVPLVLRWAVYYFFIFYLLLFSKVTDVGRFIYAQF